MWMPDVSISSDTVRAIPTPIRATRAPLSRVGLRRYCIPQFSVEFHRSCAARFTPRIVLIIVIVVVVLPIYHPKYQPWRTEMEWTLRFLSYLQILVLKILEPFYRYRDRARAPAIPPPSAKDNPLLNMSASKLAENIRHGRISSESAVRAYIDRIRQVDPIVNAVVDERYREALEDARNCDVKLRSGEVTVAHLEVKMPLYGIPFTVKESCSLKGLSHTGCTLVRRGIKATADSPIVESLKNAGAIPLCVTNTPELCSSLDASNLLYGKTTNPYDGRRVSGGSSGGEAALLGAGASLIGIGSDIAGSIRVPALFNGVYGHKPTPGIIPITGHFPMADDEIFQKYLVVGPMTRYMEDLALAMRVMSGHRANKDLALDETIDVRKLRVFYFEEAGHSFGTIPVDEDIKRSVRNAARHLENCGAQVTKAPAEPLAEIAEITVSMFFNMQNIPHVLIDPADPKHEANGFIEIMKSLVGMSCYSKSAIYMKLLKDSGGFITSNTRERYVKKGHALRKMFLEMLGDDGVLLCPSFITPAPVQGKIILQQMAGMYCLIANLFGLPATQVPMGLNAENLPIGLQVMAGPDKDRLSLAVAKELDKQFGGWIPPPTSSP